MKLIHCFLLPICLLISIEAWSDELEPAPEVSLDGLEQVEKTRRREVYAAPGADWSTYDSVIVEDVTVAFRKNWLRDQNRGLPTQRVKPSDMEDIEREIKTLFVEVFTEELLAAGYVFSEVRDHDVMIIKPAILDLSVNAPDIQVPGQIDVLTSSAGSMTLYMELYDSVSEQLLVKAVDAVADRDVGNVQLQKKVTNRAAFRRMMKPWAVALASGFGTSTGTPSPDID